MNKQIAKAIIEAQASRRLYSEIDGRNVRNGQGSMSQRYFEEMMAKRQAI